MEPRTPSPAAIAIPQEILDALDPNCSGCRLLLAFLQAQLAALAERVAMLEARLGQNSTNCSRPPSANRPGTPKRPPKQPPSGRKPGAQPGHPGVTRELKPIEAMDEVIPVIPPVCSHCHAPLPDREGDFEVPPQRHQVVDIPPTLVHFIEYQLHARTCPECQELTWASLPEGVSRSVMGPRLQAVGALLTGAFRLSRRAAQELLHDLLGEPFSLGTLAAQEAATTAALAVPYKAVAQAVAQARAVNADETRWWEANRSSWLWMAATPELALFRMDPSRSRAAFELLLPPCELGQERTVTCDRFSAYNHLMGDGREVCWSHLARDFQGWADAGGAAKPFGQRALELTGRVFHSWYAYRDEQIDRPGLCRELEPVQDAFRQLFVEAGESGHWKVAGPARQLLKHFDSLWTFTRREGVEPTNNHAERALRHAVLWRKSSFGHRSEGGRAFVERMLTAVTSLRLQRRNVLGYLEQAVRAARFGEPGPSLLPLPAT